MRAFASIALGLGFGFGALGVGLVPALGAPVAAHRVQTASSTPAATSSSAPVFTAYDTTWD